MGDKEKKVLVPLIKTALLQEQPPQPWIEAMYANALLAMTGDYLAKSLPVSKLYQEFHTFNKLSTVSLRKLNTERLAKKLCWLEAEDQDRLASKIPSYLLIEYWKMIEEAWNKEQELLRIKVIKFWESGIS